MWSFPAHLAASIDHPVCSARREQPIFRMGAVRAPAYIDGTAVTQSMSPNGASGAACCHAHRGRSVVVETSRPGSPERQQTSAVRMQLSTLSSCGHLSSVDELTFKPRG